MKSLAFAFGFSGLLAVHLPAQGPGPTKSQTVAVASQPKRAAPPTAPVIPPPGDMQKLRASPVPYRIERKGLPPNAYFKRGEIFWVPAAAKPRAFLVLASNMGKPRVSLEDQTWVKFAQQQGLGIMSIGIEEAESPIRFNEAAGDLARKIYALTEEQFGPDLKGATVAVGKGATWMHRIMMIHPWKWGFWCSHTADSYPIVARGIEYPAGLLLSSDPARYKTDLFFFEDLRRVKATNRVGFIALDGAGVPPSSINRIAQNYMLAMFSGPEAVGRWYNIYSKTELPVQPQQSPEAAAQQADGKVPPKKPVLIAQNWVPGSEMAGAWKMLHQARKKTPDCIIATATLKLPGLPESPKLFFRVPGITGEGVPVRAVQLWCVWSSTDDDMFIQLRSNTDLKSALWNRERVGVVALNMKSLGFDENLSSGDLPRLQRVMEALAPEFWKVVGNAFGELGWPRSQLFLFGHRSGASFAQMLAANDSARFTGVHLHAGSLFPGAAKPELKKIAWLVTSGGKDAGYKPTVEFYNALKDAGCPVMLKAPPNALGKVEDWTHILGVHFISAIKGWNDHIRKDITEGKTPPADTAAGMFAAAMSNPVSVADLTTSKLVVVSKMDTVPSMYRVPMPSVEFEAAWRAGGAPKKPDPTSDPTGAAAARVPPLPPERPNPQANKNGVPSPPSVPAKR